MLLESGKIYQGYKKNNFLMCPSLEVTTGVQVYVSNKSNKPNSIGEMIEIELEPNKINSFYSIPRWICVTYNSDSSKACEDGLIIDPLNSITSTLVIKNYQAIIDNNGTRLLIQPDTILIF